MKARYAGALLCATIYCACGAAFAQGIPCFSAAECAQIRIQSEQQQARQRAADEAAAEALARQQREQARVAARERAQAEAEAREAAIARAREAAKEQAAYEQERLREAQLQAEANARAEVEKANAEARLTAARLAAKQEAENRAAAQLAAENSSDNRCHDQKTAGQLLDYFNGLQTAGDFYGRAIDIEHLTTLQYDPARSVISCHGHFVLQNGERRIGTLSTRLNVAGNVLTTFHQDTN